MSANLQFAHTSISPEMESKIKRLYNRIAEEESGDPQHPTHSLGAFGAFRERPSQLGGSFFPTGNGARFPGSPRSTGLLGGRARSKRNTRAPYGNSYFDQAPTQVMVPYGMGLRSSARGGRRIVGGAALSAVGSDDQGCIQGIFGGGRKKGRGKGTVKQKEGAARNSWNQHLRDLMAQNPGLKYSEAMIMAKNGATGYQKKR